MFDESALGEGSDVMDVFSTFGPGQCFPAAASAVKATNVPQQVYASTIYMITYPQI